MEFTHLNMQDFKCFPGKTSLRLDDENKGIIFLTGKNQLENSLGANGAGKSSIWDALCWCLFGKTPKNLRAGNIQSWENPKTVVVSVEVYIKKVLHVITRTQAPNSLKVSEYPKPAEEYSQEDLDNLLGIKFESFLHSILISQTSPMFFDLSSTAKLDLFSSVMGLDKWMEFSKRASDHSKHLNDTIQSTEIELSNVEGKLEQSQSIDYKTLIKEWEEDRDSNILKLEEEYKISIEKRKPLAEEFEESTGNFNGLKKDRVELITLKNSKENRLRDVTSVFNSLERNKAVLLSKIEGYEDEMARIEDLDSCPTCLQIVKSDHKKDHSAISEKSIVLLEDELKVLDKKIEDSKTTKDTLSEEVVEIQSKIDKFQTKINKLHVKVNQLESEIKTIDNTLDSIESRVEEKEKEINPYSLKQRELLNSIKDYEKEIKEKSKLVDSLQDEYRTTSFWIKGFKEVRLYMILTSLKQLEVEVNSCLSELGLVEWEITFSVDHETKSKTIKKGFHVMIKSPYNKEMVPWECWSGGETQRLRVAGTMGLSNLILNSLGIDSNLEVWDEPSTWLSKEGINDLLETLHFRATNYGKNLWLVDHRSLEFGKFIDIVKVIKGKEGSYIEHESF